MANQMMDGSLKNGLNNINCCIVCFMKEPLTNDPVHLSTKLNKRLKYVTEIVPENNLADYIRKLSVRDEDEGKRKSGESTGMLQPSTKAGNTGNPDICIEQEVRTFFVLKHVFQHPLDHPTTEKMMLLVQSPSDWFSICARCRVHVDHGIDLIKSLRTIKDRECLQWHVYEKKLEEVVGKIRTTFYASYLGATSPGERNVSEDKMMKENGNVYTMNFLLTEEQAVQEFRLFLHKSAFARIVGINR